MREVLTKFEFDLLSTMVDDIEPLAVVYRDFRRKYDIEFRDFLSYLNSCLDKHLVACFRYSEEALGAKGCVHREEVSHFDIDKVSREYDEFFAGVDLESIMYDEIGYYCKITSEGFDRWREYASIFEGYVEIDEALWHVEEDFEARRVRISAKKEEIADRLLKVWKQKNADKKVIDETIHRRNVDSFRLKYYREVQQGFEISFTYFSTQP